jgi:CRP-like cAMP-binding protein
MRRKELYWLMSGQVLLVTGGELEVSRPLPAPMVGQEEVAIAYPGDLLGVDHLFNEEGPPVPLALTPVTFVGVPASFSMLEIPVLREFLRRDEAALQFVFENYRRGRQAVIDQHNFNAAGFTIGVYHAVLAYAARSVTATVDRDGLRVRISRTDLARIVGCSREMCGRVLTSLHATGLLVTDHKHVLVPDRSTA